MDELGKILSELSKLNFVEDCWLDPEVEDNTFSIKLSVRPEIKDKLWEDWFGY